jgi:hypothetical protein
MEQDRILLCSLCSPSGLGSRLRDLPESSVGPKLHLRRDAAEMQRHSVHQQGLSRVSAEIESDTIFGILPASFLEPGHFQSNFEPRCSPRT